MSLFADITLTFLYFKCLSSFSFRIKVTANEGKLDYSDIIYDISPNQGKYLRYLHKTISNTANNRSLCAFKEGANCDLTLPANRVNVTM